MSKAVFTTKINPTYDDLPSERYHFPNSYLNQVTAALDDWIVYYEPRRASADLSSRGGRQVYFAIARVANISADPNLAGHFYASVADYLEFDHPAPFRDRGNYYESALQRADGGTNRGAFGRAVRFIPDHEYDLILKAGFARVLNEMSPAQAASPLPFEGFADDPPAEFERPIIERIVARPFRDAAFSTLVKTAYGDACAMTGLKIINGGGRSEVQAAHIRPVASAGPDSVRNGLALCGTVHWMFDRGLISIDDDHRLLIASKGIPDALGRMINPDWRLRRPERAEFLPHPKFLRFHRENVFKG